MNGRFGVLPVFVNGRSVAMWAFPVRARVKSGKIRVVPTASESGSHA